MNKSIEQLFNLSGKVAVITGGAGMLGQQHAEILSDAGANVVIVDINQEICDAVAKKITERNGVEALGLEVDISQELAVQKMLEKIKNKFGRVDILINNAVAKPKAFFKKVEDYPLDDWEQVMAVNLNAAFACSKILGGEMAQQGQGVILNIGSVYGLVGTDQSIYGSSGINAPAVYAASKGGIINLTRYLATYWGNKGVRVNSLCPGGVENNQDPEFIKKYCAKTPLGRMAKKDDFKGAILFLVSDASSYMTGANLVVDGGWTAW